MLPCRKILKCYPFKIIEIQYFFLRRCRSSLRHLSDVHSSLRNQCFVVLELFYIDEMNFNVNDTVNNQKRCIWNPKNPHAIKNIVLLTSNVTVWCQFIYNSYWFHICFQEISRCICTRSITIISDNCRTMLLNFLIIDPQQKRTYNLPPLWRIKHLHTLN